MWLLLATPTPNFQLDLGVPQGEPPSIIPKNQAPPLFPFGHPPYLGTNYQGQAQFGQYDAGLVGSCVFQRGYGRPKPDAMVEGTVTCPSQGVAGEVATLLVATRVLRMASPVGMEVQVVVAVARG